MDNTARPSREPWLLLFLEKKDTFKSSVVRGIVASVQVDIYSFFQRLNIQLLKLFQGVESDNSGQKMTKIVIKDYQQVQGESWACIFVCVWVCFSREDCFPMVPDFYRAAKKAWFRTIQEVYCWRENPLLALQTEALQSWTSRKPARPPVCSFSMACCIMKPDRVRGGVDTRVESEWLGSTEEPQHLRLCALMAIFSTCWILRWISAVKADCLRRMTVKSATLVYGCRVMQ